MAIALCPICGLEGGFHLSEVHAQHEVPREVLKEPGWHKAAHEELLWNRAAKAGELVLVVGSERDGIDDIIAASEDYQSQIEQLAAQLDEDKQGWATVYDDHGNVLGDVLILGTRPTEHATINEEWAEALSELLPLPGGGG